MVDSITAHLVRRGYEAVSSGPVLDGDEIAKRFQSPLAIFSMVMSGLVFILMSLMLEYSIRFVVGNLTVIEDVMAKSTTKRVPVVRKGYTDDVVVDGQEKELLLNEDYIDLDNESNADVEVVLPKPVTRSIRGTQKYLRSIGNMWSTYRGFKYFVVYGLAAMASRGVFSAIFRRFPFGRVIADILSVLVTCRLRAVWTHATIAAPSSKTFRQRILPRSEAKHLILPSIRAVVATRVAAYATCAASMFARKQIDDSIFQASRHGARLCAMNFAWIALPIVVGLFTTVFFVFPTNVALIRVEASLLPESDEAVVPFDRTFGGRINWNPSPEDENLTVGRRCRCKSAKARYFFRNMTLGGAWKTIGAQAARRIMKFYVKFFFMCLAFATWFVLWVTFQAYVLLGDQAEPLIEAARQHLRELHP